MNIEAIIRTIQTELGAEVDGVAGPETWEKIYDRIFDKKPIPLPTHDDSVDERSERAIVTLLEEVQPYARALVNAAAAQGIKIIVTSGTRTYEEQDELYEQGRSKPGNAVTNARGGYSNHNFGIAFDVTIFNGGTPVWESPLYKAVGALGKSLGLTWGGDWKSFNDEPHFELKPKWAKGLEEKEMLAQLRDLKQKGQNPFNA